jgi:hypothetical protein
MRGARPAKLLNSGELQRVEKLAHPLLISGTDRSPALKNAYPKEKHQMKKILSALVAVAFAIPVLAQTPAAAPRRGEKGHGGSRCPVSPRTLPGSLAVRVHGGLK